ncbi:MAG: trypsin-like serine protease [Fimbriimonadaceae bacterium]
MLCKSLILLAMAPAWVLAVAPGQEGDTDALEFRSVGKVFSASAVLVGPDLVLTAKHVGMGQFRLPFYGNFDPVGQPMVEPSSDIMLFRIDNRGMQLPYTPVLGNPVPDGAQISMVGYGVSGILNGSGTGYDMSLPRGPRRWANAIVDRTEYMDYGSFVPGYSLISILRQNGQGALANGDSGGGIFQTINGRDYVVGINSFIDVWGNWNGGQAYLFSLSDTNYFASGAVSLAHYATWLRANGAIVVYLKIPIKINHR